jgi:succinoglycan biosynthesis transport protein ExoP
VIESNVSIIDYAQQPTAPIRPLVTRNILLGLMLGLMLGVGVSFFQEYMDSSIKDEQEVRKYLNLPLLAAIPEIRGGFAYGTEVPLITLKDSKAVETEIYKILRTNLKYSHISPSHYSLLVTSAVAEEGKTTTLLNLAVVSAAAGSKVVVVDADLRKPIIHSIFNIDNSIGITTFLIGEVTDIDRLIVRTSVENLSVVPCGPISPNPSELLDSEEMRTFVRLLKERFDLVLFDSPPISMVTDAAIMASYADGVILVVQSGKVDRGINVQAKHNLEKVKAKVLGVVLNNIKRKKSSYYYNYYYGYR